MIPSNCYDVLMKQSWDEHEARHELFRSDPLPAIYTVSTETEFTLIQRTSQVVKRVLSLLFFPVYLSQKCYQIAHRLMGYYLIPACFKNRNYVLRFVENWNLTTFLMASTSFSVGLLPTLSQNRPPPPSRSFFSFQDLILKFLGRRDLEAGKKWQFQRFSVEADQQKIDAIFIGRKKDSSSSKWFWSKKEEPSVRNRVILYCCSQHELAEGEIHDDQELLALAEKTQSDVVVWNPPGLGATPGELSRESMVKACQSMLRFVEDAKGLGAKEIICSGHSLGAAILLEAQKNHVLAPSIRYVFVLRSAFSTMQESLAFSVCSLFGLAIRFLGWNLNNTEALKKVKAPVIILQTASVDKYQTLANSSRLMPDTVIEDPDATLAKAVLDQEPLDPLRKVIGVPRWHDEPLMPEHITSLSKDIEESFKIV